VAVFFKLQRDAVGDAASVEFHRQGGAQLAPAEGGADEDGGGFGGADDFGQQCGLGLDAEAGQGGVLGQEDGVGSVGDGFLGQGF
jgi:hypothetical protein